MIPPAYSSIAIALISTFSNTTCAKSVDPLPAWNNGPVKAAIIDFVERVTTPSSPTFVPPEERIAVFDNDGTLWSEKPFYFQLVFAMDRIKKLAPNHPEWQAREPFASILQGDLEHAISGGKSALIEMLKVTHANMTTEEFRIEVRKWLNTAKHPRTDRPYDKMVYQPMLELLNFFREKSFKTYIVSGGGIDFMRVFAEEAYGIPPEQVIGSSVKAKYEVRKGVPEIIKQPQLNLVNDKAEKPVAIYQHIGRRPIAAIGNSDGDLEMLEWTAAGQGDRFCLVVHHTDDQREWAYDRESEVGRLDALLEKAQRNSWQVVSMKHDWNVVFRDFVKAALKR